MSYQLLYVVRGTQYTLKYPDRKDAIGNACHMMKLKDCSALQLLDSKGFPLMTYTLEPEETRRRGYIEG